MGFLPRGLQGEVYPRGDLRRQLRVFFLPRYFKPKVYVYPMAGSKYEILVSRVGVLASIVSFFRK